MKNLGNVFILGDSYSTFENAIAEGNLPYYGSRHPESDVTSADKTWWGILLNKTNSSLLLNDSWSGTTVCFTGWEGRNSRPNAFISRLENLIENGYFKENKPDTFIVFGGTNDSWSNAPLGELKFSDWQDEDLYSTLLAFCCLLNRIGEILPESRIIAVINHDIKDEIINNYSIACKKANVQCIKLHDIDKQNGHPTAKGMEQLAEQIYNFL